MNPVCCEGRLKALATLMDLVCVIWNIMMRLRKSTRFNPKGLKCKVRIKKHTPLRIEFVHGSII